MIITRGYGSFLAITRGYGNSKRRRYASSEEIIELDSLIDREVALSSIIEQFIEEQSEIDTSVNLISKIRRKIRN